ncbi:hypothetical protein [Aureimonas jatrophae]|uniref:Uncharacterized protein n=1 Tax=Aureimonas jatrophae TaxID=1166073 RepID=A0A1H0K346_9HYPH|nr:hypothetical protein [Aureimonas jatrophae]MBB3950921.1 hypothetical protein [Aureimonas jatrophae]SDO50267.1 hypothetical protein SAMN05192530_10767 [Aureimonas jatrophae]
MSRRREEDISPAEAQNTGPFHRSPPGPPERRDPSPASDAVSPLRPGGEAEARDDL